MPAQEKHFRDPIYGYIDVNGCALDIVNSPFFQRLRHVKQLAFSYLTFHGAQHTRFEHSLGVYHLAKQLVAQFDIDKAVEEEFCLAALLHDIGHHPYSHAFETAIRSAYEGQEDLDHEAYTDAILNFTEIKDSISAAGLDVARVKGFLQGTETRPEYVFLNSLISSELDLDRMDYLRRDSYYCGVPHGRYDFDRLLRSIENVSNEVVIMEKGRHAAELFILARFFMYVVVYNHHTTRAFDIMIRTIFDQEYLDSIHYPRPNQHDITRFLDYDDAWLWTEIKKLARQHENAMKQTLAKNILYRNPLRCVIQRIAYSPAETSLQDKLFTLIEDLARDTTIQQIAHDAGINPKWLFTDTPLRKVLFESRFYPYRGSYSTEDEEREAVIKINSTEGPQDIARDPSTLLSSISRNIPKVIRIYTLKKYRKQVGHALAQRNPDLKKIIQYC